MIVDFLPIVLSVMRALTINHRHSLFTHASRSTASSQWYDILVIFSTLKAKRQCRWRRLTLCGRFYCRAIGHFGKEPFTVQNISIFAVF